MAVRSRSDSPASRRPAPKAEHSSRRAPAAGDSSATVAGVRISHPDRVIYPDLEISKIEFARYFERIADWIVPHVAGRPLTLVHCPAGIAAPCHFLKHAKAWGPSALRRVRIQEKTKVGEYLVADSIEAVVSLAQMGIVEIHTWNSTADDIERPNRIVWDLDPGPEVSWQQVVKAAELVREVLTTLKLRSWVKTTGGRGLHVVVPLKPKRTVAECLDFSRAVSEAIVRADPRAYTTDVREVRPRAQDPHRLPQKQPHQHVGVCVLSTRAARGGGVDAARLERVASPAGTLDDSDGSETACSHPNGPMGGLLGRRSNYFGRVVRSRHTPLFDVRAPTHYDRFSRSGGIPIESTRRSSSALRLAPRFKFMERAVMVSAAVAAPIQRTHATVDRCIEELPETPNECRRLGYR